MEEYCKHCGWPKTIHLLEGISDNRKGNFDYSYDDCPGFELDDED